ncbi:MAG: hypothetical protein M0Z39_10480 [Actinomycetota bacterium]|jgi:hypothetical protein|nr:hypothetical protein [Actinomycetota bacterium]
MSEAQVTPEWCLEHFDPWDKRITYSNVWGCTERCAKTLLQFTATHLVAFGR